MRHVPERYPFKETLLTHQAQVTRGVNMAPYGLALQSSVGSPLPGSAHFSALLHWAQVSQVTRDGTQGPHVNETHRRFPIWSLGPAGPGCLTY